MEIDLSRLPEVVNDNFYPLLFDDTPLEVFMGGANSGKCFGKGTEILMADGKIKKVEEITIDEKVMGPDSKPRIVLGTTVGSGMLYKVHQRRGDDYIVNGNHILCLKKTDTTDKFKHEPTYCEIPVKEYMSKNETWKRYHMGYRVPIDFPYKKVEIDSYFLGLWLNNKIIPDDYLYNSREIRLQLLAGLIDTDGYFGNHCYYIGQKNEVLAHQIKFLANSLGFRCSIKYGTLQCYDNVIIGSYCDLCISGNIEGIPCKIERKKALSTLMNRVRKSKEFYATGIDVKEIGVGEYFGFAVDGDHKFLLSDCTVTHNSYFVSQKVVFKLLQPEHRRILLCRKVKKDVRHSCYDLLKHTISMLGFEELFKFNDTETIVKCKLNENDAIGVGLDDVEKLKSIFDPTDFWGEEADQMAYNDIDQLMLRLRGSDNAIKQGMLSFNPVWVGHWLKKEYFDKKVPGVITNRSNYKMNKFLDQRTKEIMEGITDPYRKMVYVDGEWGVYGSRVFSNFIIEDFKYTEDDLENVFTGMDFGFAHASVIERGGFRDGELYIFDELYGKGWGNSTFIRAAQEYFGDEGYYFEISADSAEPDRIAEWKSAGFHIEPAIKGPGSYAYGIDFMKSFKIHIHEKNCPNLQREIQTFERRENRFGEMTEEFIQENDDCIAAIRYGTEKFWHNEMYGGNVADLHGINALALLGL